MSLEKVNIEHVLKVRRKENGQPYLIFPIYNELVPDGKPFYRLAVIMYLEKTAADFYYDFKSKEDMLKALEGLQDKKKLEKMLDEIDEDVNKKINQNKSNGSDDAGQTKDSGGN